MNAAALLLLLVFTISWYVLALLPALREVALKTDARPLTVVSDHDGSATHFAKSSLAFISANFPGTFVKQRGARIEGLLENGNPYSMIPFDDDIIELEPGDFTGSSIDRVLMSYAPIRVPPRSAVLSTIYAAREVYGEPGSVYRALFSEGDIDIGPDSVVSRWIHSEGRIIAQENTSLFGRASAARGIRMMPGSKFERISAPRIEFGLPGSIRDPISSPLTPAAVQHLPEMVVPRAVVRDSIIIPPNSFVGHDIVSSGSIRIGRGSWIAGSVKAAEDVLIDGEARVDGSVVAERDIFIGAQCFVRGPIIAERSVLIEGPTAVGAPQLPTTITAPRVYCASGVVVFGSVWAREEGGIEKSLPAEIKTEEAAA